MQHAANYLTARQVRERYSISDMALWRWLNKPDLNFPRPIVINRRRYFDEAAITAWERARAGAVAA